MMQTLSSPRVTATPLGRQEQPKTTQQPQSTISPDKETGATENLLKNKNSDKIINQTRSPWLVTVNVMGRLGNLMFEYASLLGIAHTNGRTAVYPQRELTKFFQVSAPPAPPNSHPETWKKFGESKALCFDKRTNSLPNENIRLKGFLQSWKYFEEIKDKIRKEFRFKASIEKNIREVFYRNLEPYLHEGRTVISIHVRRGDVANDKRFQNWGTFVPDPSFYNKAMALMAKKYPFCVFLVVSNDAKWCEKNVKPIFLKYRTDMSDDKSSHQFLINVGNATDEIVNVSEKTRDKILSHHKINSTKKENASEFLISLPLVFSKTNTPEVDMGQLSLANHSIVSYGTYAWWGAWLAGGDVIYYKDWIRPGTVYGGFYSQQDYFPSNWIGV